MTVPANEKGKKMKFNRGWNRRSGQSICNSTQEVSDTGTPQLRIKWCPTRSTNIEEVDNFNEVLFICSCYSVQYFFKVSILHQ